MKVEIYSDVACPWCYIGKRRFERALAGFAGAAGVEVVYRPYQLDPSAAATATPLMPELTRRYGTRAREMAGNAAAAGRAEGLTMDFDRALASNTLAAHRLLHLAETEYGAAVQQAVSERLFAAHFGGGADVSDLAVLTGLATEAGMDRARVGAYLASNEGTAEVRAGIATARELGITAVPTFVFEDRYAVQGAQPPAAFLQALETVAGELRADAPPAGDADCADGACAVPPAS
jgi:predicted DsbA family dithiol-disulfide isomerase